MRKLYVNWKEMPLKPIKLVIANWKIKVKKKHYNSSNEELSMFAIAVWEGQIRWTLNDSLIQFNFYTWRKRGQGRMNYMLKNLEWAMAEPAFTAQSYFWYRVLSNVPHGLELFWDLMFTRWTRRISIYIYQTISSYWGIFSWCIF